MKNFDQVFDERSFDEQADAARAAMWEAILAHAKSIPASDQGMALFITLGGALTACGMAAAYFMEKAPNIAASIETGFIEQFQQAIKDSLAGHNREVPN